MLTRCNVRDECGDVIVAMLTDWYDATTAMVMMIMMNEDGGDDDDDEVVVVVMIMSVTVVSNGI